LNLQVISFLSNYSYAFESSMLPVGGLHPPKVLKNVI
jgi:hypothetical protein